jgi:hypothetical protein
MTALKDRIKTALDESRMLILGSQVLLGFQYRSALESTFEKLPRASQLSDLAALAIMLLVIALLMSPGAYHRIVYDGEDREDLHGFTTKVMDIALLPFAIALGVDVYIAAGILLGVGSGVIAGSVAFLIAVLFWYGIAMVQKRGRQHTKRTGHSMNNENDSQRTRLKDKIEQVLLEARVVLPGAQALLGFQFVTMFMDGFEALPLSSKYIHLASLALMALTIIFLMSPAAFHRIVEKGEETERIHSFASSMLLAAMVPLPLGMSGDFFVVVRKVTGSESLAIGGSAIMLLFFYSLWFGFTIYRRRKLRT